MDINLDALKNRNKNKDFSSDIDYNLDVEKYIDDANKRIDDYIKNWIYQYIITRYTHEEFIKLFDDFQTFSDFMEELGSATQDEYNRIVWGNLE